MYIYRRDFLARTAIGAATIGTLPAFAVAPAKKDYTGPNVVIIRFGGGVRRRETVDRKLQSHCPYLLNDLASRGVLFENMRIDTAAQETSHGQGTLNILTGKYDKYTDVEDKFLGERFEAKVPTLFEYFRQQYNIPEYQTLIVNGEDRTDEEFYTFSNHHLFGAKFRSNVLSLYRYKTHLLKQQIKEGRDAWSEENLTEKQKELSKMLALDYRRKEGDDQSPELQKFWQRWRKYYGDSGLVNPRGDRLLTELTVRAIKELRPKLLMVNYNDPDYVHWGNMAHYTRGIAVMDRGVRHIVNTIEADEEYRDNTVLVIVPDCGRDDSKFVAVPCQHHFNTRTSREIFALLVGPGIAKNQIVDHPVEQNQVAATVGRLMGYKTSHAEGAVLEEGR